MKRKLLIISAVLTVAAMLLTGCAKSKKMLASSSDELTAVGSVAGYDIPMEMYRYVALNYRDDFDGGDSSVWLGESGEALLAELNAAVDETVLRMYTTAAVCEDYGISPDDKFFTETVEMQMESVYESYGNDYKAYAEELKANHLTDSVYRFILRDSLISEQILEKMVEKGDIPAFGEDFRSIAQSGEFVRIKQILIAPGETKSDEECRQKIEDVKKRLDSGADFDTVLWENGEDIFLFNNPDGYYISCGSYYTDFEDAAFSLEIGEISGIIKTPAGYSILKRYEKEDAYIDSHLEDMYITYRDGRYNLALEAKKAEISVEWNENKDKYTIFTMK